MKKVSIIVPIYNAQQHISNCLTSIINQDYKNLEIILVDDGSTDNSFRICEGYAEKDSRIRLIYQENMGPGSARNHGIDCATSEFITFVDSDDFLEKNYVSSLVNQQQKFDSDISISFYKIFDDESYHLVMDPVPGDTKYDGIYEPNELLDIFSRTIPMEDSVPWNKLYKISLFKHIRYPEHQVTGEDTFTTWRLMLFANRVSFQNIITYNYRVHRKDSITGKTSDFVKYYGNVKAIEEKIAVINQIGLDTSYMYRFYKECLENLYNLSLKTGNYDMLKNIAFKLKMINNYHKRKKNNK